MSEPNQSPEKGPVIKHSFWRRSWRFIGKHSNFYRIHLVVFTITPLIFSGIFYASNGQNKISWVDSWFMCVTSMAVCGLATVDLSSLTPFQQALLLFQMCIGNPIAVSWLMVYSRKRFLEQRCTELVNLARAEQREKNRTNPSIWRRLRLKIMKHREHSQYYDDASEVERAEERHFKEKSREKIRPDMIRRMPEINLRPVNPSGAITDNNGVPSSSAVNSATGTPTAPLSRQTSPASTNTTTEDSPIKPLPLNEDPFPRTVTFQDGPNIRQRRGTAPKLDADISEERRLPRVASRASLPRTQTRQASIDTIDSRATRTSYQSRKHEGFGGFPVFAILKELYNKLFPNSNLGQRLHLTLTQPVTTTLSRVPTGATGNRQASYLPENSNIKIGRNSHFFFEQLSPEERTRIGMTEYHALSLLLWVVGCYHITVQLLSFAAIAPYMSRPRWQDNFVQPQLIRPVSPVWFSAFQAVSAYTNTGTSLVDQSMLPFQSAYLMILVMMFSILAGNTCFPIFLRFVLWTMKHLYSDSGSTIQAIDFLLDHPRRCYIYLFPSHQTWFLLTIVILLTMTDFISYIILDIGNEALAALPTGVRVLDGLMQSIAVRAAGFGIVPLSALAPAVKVLYVVMMYISIFPIAMSVRSTNVYEQKSLGIYDPDEEDEANFDENNGTRVQVWGRYLAFHARQQLAFDMWWIVLAIFLVCICERHNLEDPEKSWFNLFNVIFELTSAYGIVGLSLGSPIANYSFSGTFWWLSKVIVCIVIIRGRHRGLPVALDRAVMFPTKFANDTAVEKPAENDDAPDTHSLSQASIRSPPRDQPLPPPILTVNPPDASLSPPILTAHPEEMNDVERVHFPTGMNSRPRSTSHADRLSILSSRMSREPSSGRSHHDTPQPNESQAS